MLVSASTPCMTFQCPRGHFCFSDRAARRERAEENWVSMPARAFLLFGQLLALHLFSKHKSFNAREGIFAFRTGDTAADWWLENLFVSMPARAFLLFGLFSFGTTVIVGSAVFQCPRGHFCFSDEIQKYRIVTPAIRFQCPRGHFCFSDETDEVFGSEQTLIVSMPARAFLLFGREWWDKTADVLATRFNAREGIFAFRTNSPRPSPRSV